MTSYGTQSHYRDRQFAAADSNFGDFPPLYSELPFSKRRKRGDNDVVKWAMRAVLASPILVLCLWTVGAMMFANKHVSSNTNAQVVKQRQAQMANNSPILTMPQQQLQQENMMMISQNQVPQQQMIALAPPQQQQPMMTQPAEMQPQVMQASSQIQAPVLAMQPEQSEPVMQMQPKHQGTINMDKKGHRPAVNHRPMPRNPQPLMEQQPQQPLQQQQMQPIQQQTMQQQTQPQILYYDPKQAMANGQLEVPLVVYDQYGNPIPLQHLRGARIFMEPPQIQEQQMPSPARKMSASDLQKWGQSTSQDQSVIVATVAVMALLVGALSARRMRSRNVLSVCIENEALEDDVAYDTAYTTSENSYYNTFASGGWKGDLEKFDV